MKNKLIYIVSLLFFLAFTSCESMESNYAHYLDVEPYAAKITNLTIENALNQCTLTWDLPEKGDITEMLITYDDQEIRIEATEEYTIEDLPIKGYTFYVYSINKHGHVSVPTSIFGFPADNN